MPQVLAGPITGGCHKRGHTVLAPYLSSTLGSTGCGDVEDVVSILNSLPILNWLGHRLLIGGVPYGQSLQVAVWNLQHT